MNYLELILAIVGAAVIVANAGLVVVLLLRARLDRRIASRSRRILSPGRCRRG